MTISILELENHVEKIDITSLQGEGVVTAWVYPCRGPIGRLFANRRTMYPLARHNQWFYATGAGVVSCHKGEHPFVWMTTQRELVIRTKNYFLVTSITRLMQTLGDDDREQLMLALQGKHDEAANIRHERHEQMIDSIA